MQIFSSSAVSSAKSSLQIGIWCRFDEVLRQVYEKAYGNSRLQCVWYRHNGWRMTVRGELLDDFAVGQAEENTQRMMWVADLWLNDLVCATRWLDIVRKKRGMERTTIASLLKLSGFWDAARWTKSWPEKQNQFYQPCCTQIGPSHVCCD